ncbi:helix-turn-helix transcriptional regulator [Shimia haliotis]|uniref:Transcriptional regulator, AlpA family n=1 Tax=Shimia haliotis TaxID=1280847 RepID=A0A1I4HBP0_9RHOB|nr:AlpA family phage regulatory protein [Shimia haliotis]SFL39624.1 transcriptional regulator, AlpA family [Shimia haliotis]
MNLITFQELQRKLGGRSRSQIYRDLEANRIPRPIKFGSRLYWNEADIDAAISAHAG